MCVCVCVCVCVRARVCVCYVCACVHVCVGGSWVVENVLLGGLEHWKKKFGKTMLNNVPPPPPLPLTRNNQI